MNKNKSRNGAKQVKKREPRSSSQGCGRNKRRKNLTLNSFDSGINFVVNVSSSGTNLSKKIQDEMTKLEEVERKLRGHKTKAKALCSSVKVANKTPDDRKLKHMLEDLLKTVDFGGIKPKIKSRCISNLKELEKDNTSKKKFEKCRKHSPNGVKIDSFTSLKDKHSSKREKRSDAMRKSTRKSPLKKPSTAPSGKSDSLVRDLKFAESLNFGKEVDLHLSISDMKNIKNETSRKDVNRDNFKLVIEKTSTSNINYIYDSTSFDNVNYEEINNENKRKRGILFAEENHPFQQRISNEMVVPEENEKENIVRVKPERKRFYSFLKRGNFTISRHTDETVETNSVEEIPSEKNSESVVENQMDAPKDEPSEIQDKNTNYKGDHCVSTDLSMFPTDLIERSIVAVENVLRTINSLTKDFSTRKEILEKSPEIIRSPLGDGLKNHGKLTVNTNEEQPQKEIVMLKSPIQSFFASEETINCHYLERSHNKLIHQFKKEHSHERLDPLSKALNSLKRSEEPTTYDTSEQSIIKQSNNFSSSFVNVTISQKLYKNHSFSFCSKTNFSNNRPLSSNESVVNRVVPANTNRYHNENPPDECEKSFCTDCSKFFPEYNFQKCLSLLRKKFRDFEKIRKNRIDKLTLEKMLTVRNNDEYNKKVDMIQEVKQQHEERYQVCFKNENFKNQSETSVESWIRIDVEKVGFRIDPVEGKAKSSPEMKS